MLGWIGPLLLLTAAGAACIGWKKRNLRAGALALLLAATGIGGALILLALPPFRGLPPGTMLLALVLGALSGLGVAHLLLPRSPR